MRSCDAVVIIFGLAGVLTRETGGPPGCSSVWLLNLIFTLTLTLTVECRGPDATHEKERLVSLRYRGSNEG
jgi:hypothetical protein